MKDYIKEAIKLLKLIDENKINKKEDYLFVQSMRARIKSDTFISEKQIFWLRDIKDRQLERLEREESEI